MCGENLQSDWVRIWCSGDQCQYEDVLVWKPLDGSIMGWHEHKEEGLNPDWVTPNAPTRAT